MQPLQPFGGVQGGQGHHVLICLRSEMVDSGAMVWSHFQHRLRSVPVCTPRIGNTVHRSAGPSVTELDPLFQRAAAVSLSSPSYYRCS